MFSRIEVAEAGEFSRILYGVHESPFGRCAIGLVNGALCSVEFLGSEEWDFPWKDAMWTRDGRQTAAMIDDLMSSEDRGSVRIVLRGTRFQRQVWSTLAQIDVGEVVSYQEVADRVGRPSACRAVANAIAANPIALAIPCHRVVRKSGEIGGYRWGVQRKRALLHWESSIASTFRQTSLPLRRPQSGKAPSRTAVVTQQMSLV